MKGMRFFSLVIMALFITGFASVAQAEKVGTVDLLVVVFNCDKGKAEQAKLQKTFKPEQEKIEKMRAAINSEVEKLRSQAQGLSPSALEDRRAKLQRQQRDFEDAQQELARRLNIEESRLRREMTEHVMKACKTYAEKNGYSLIIEKGAGGVLYFNPAVDLTQAVIAEANKIK